LESNLTTSVKIKNIHGNKINVPVQVIQEADDKKRLDVQKTDWRNSCGKAEEGE
jgi:hypothetical protein